jgi:putative ABC transport system permease protein
VSRHLPNTVLRRARAPLGHAGSCGAALVIAFVVLAPSQPASAQSLSTFLEAASTHAIDVREAEGLRDQARSSVDEARARLLPSFTASGAYQRNEYEVIVMIPAGTGTVNATITPYDQLSGTFTLNVPIVDLSAWETFFASESTADAADARAEAAVFDASLSTSTAYYQLVAARAVVASAERARAAAEENLRYVESRLGPGLASELDQARAASDVARAGQTVAEAELQVTLAARNLYVLTGIEAGAEGFELVRGSELSGEGELADWLAQLDEVPAVRAARLDREAATRTRDAAWMGLLPVLSGAASERVTNAAGFGPTAAWSLGLTLSWTIDFGRPAAIATRDEALSVASLREERARIMARIGVKMMFHDRLKLAGTLFGVVFAWCSATSSWAPSWRCCRRTACSSRTRRTDLWVLPPGTMQTLRAAPMLIERSSTARGRRRASRGPSRCADYGGLKLPERRHRAGLLVGTRRPRSPVARGTSSRATRRRCEPDAVIFEDAEREKFGGLNLGSRARATAGKVQRGRLHLGPAALRPAYAFAEFDAARRCSSSRRPDTPSCWSGCSRAPTRRGAREPAGGAARHQVMTRESTPVEIVTYLTARRSGSRSAPRRSWALIVGFVIVALSMFSRWSTTCASSARSRPSGPPTSTSRCCCSCRPSLYALVGSLMGLGLVTGCPGHPLRTSTPCFPPWLFAHHRGAHGGRVPARLVLALLRVRASSRAMVFRCGRPSSRRRWRASPSTSAGSPSLRRGRAGLQALQGVDFHVRRASS